MTTASAQGLVSNGTFAISNGTTSFAFGGFAPYGGPGNPAESLAGWTFIPSGTTSTTSGAGFDMANGQESAFYAGATSQILPTTISAPVGGNFLAFDANWGGATQSPGVSQVISGLTVGASYTLAFSYALTEWYGYANTAPGESVAWAAILGGTSHTAPTVTINTTGGFSGWATATFTYIATSASETLQLLATSGSGAPPVALLANVSLTKAPEPTGLALLGTGIAALMVVARRRRVAARRG